MSADDSTEDDVRETIILEDEVDPDGLRDGVDPAELLTTIEMDSHEVDVVNTRPMEALDHETRKRPVPAEVLEAARRTGELDEATRERSVWAEFSAKPDENGRIVIPARVFERIPDGETIRIRVRVDDD